LARGAGIKAIGWRVAGWGEKVWRCSIGGREGWSSAGGEIKKEWLDLRLQGNLSWRNKKFSIELIT
jgi:hypothetical protein